MTWYKPERPRFCWLRGLFEVGSGKAEGGKGEGGKFRRSEGGKTEDRKVRSSEGEKPKSSITEFGCGRRKNRRWETEDRKVRR